MRPSERLTAAFLALLLLLALLLHPPGWPREAVLLAALLGGAGLLPRARGPVGACLRDFGPVLVVLGSFLLLQPLLVAVDGHRWDPVLAQLDRRLFGAFAEHWREAFRRPPHLTDLMYAAYLSFYALPVAVAALARRRLGPEGFERVVFILLLGFYLSFLGYFLCPAEGPRVPQALEASILGGGAFSEAARAFLRASERTTLDAFPSGHTALALLSAAVATRPFPRLAPLLWAWALAIIFATVYLSLHYLVDVAAGLLLVPLTLLIAGPVRHCCAHLPRAARGRRPPSEERP